MALQRTKPQDVYIDTGNALSVYIDAITGELMLKDSNGKVDLVSNFVGGIGNFIKNQYTEEQTANFWISGKGKIGKSDGTKEFNVLGSINVADTRNNVFLGDSQGPVFSESNSFNNNIAIGVGNFVLLEDGTSNIAIGANTLELLVHGTGNIAIGEQAMLGTETANDNLAIGISSLSQTKGNENVALGNYTLVNNDTGEQNVAVGVSTLQFNTTGNANVAIGYGSLAQNITGYENVCVGASANYNNQTGLYNTAIGSQAMAHDNTNGSNNVAIGYQAAYNITSDDNIAIGFQSMLNIQVGTNNVFVGNNTGSITTNASVNNVVSVGSKNTSEFNNCLLLGTNVVAFDDNEIHIGSNLHKMGSVSSDVPFITDSSVIIFFNDEAYKIPMMKI